MSAVVVAATSLTSRRAEAIAKEQGSAEIYPNNVRIPTRTALCETRPLHYWSGEIIPEDIAFLSRMTASSAEEDGGNSSR